MHAPRTILAGSLIAFALLLTGCATSGGDAGSTDTSESKSATESETTPEVAAGQSVEEACAVVQAGLIELSEATTGEVSADPAASAAALKNAEVSLKEAGSEVTNAEVAAVASSAGEAIGAYNTYIDSILADPENADLTKMAEQTTALQTGLSDLVTACGPAA